MRPSATSAGLCSRHSEQKIGVAMDAKVDGIADPQLHARTNWQSDFPPSCANDCDHRCHLSRPLAIDQEPSHPLGMSRTMLSRKPTATSCIAIERLRPQTFFLKF